MAKKNGNISEVTARLYDHVLHEYAKGFSEPSEHIEDFLALLHAGSSILDAGCGHGMDAVCMSARGFKVTGVDISPGMIAMAKKNCPAAEFHLADIATFDMGENNLDGVIASFSLIHMPKDVVRVIMGNFWRALKPEGILCLGLQGGKSEEKWEKVPLKPDAVSFLNIYSEREIEHLLFENGFNIKHRFKRSPKNGELPYSKICYIAEKKVIAFSNTSKG